MQEAERFLELVSSHPFKVTIALDTNIVSFLCQSEGHFLHSLVAHVNCIPLVSDIVLNELHMGTPSREFQYLDDLGAKKIRFYDDVDSTGTVKTHDLGDAEPPNPAAEAVEESLIEFSRKFIGTKSETDLVTSINNANQIVVDWLEVEGASDYAKTLSSQNADLLANFPTVLTGPDPVNSEDELASLGMGKVNLGNVRAPSIIKNIVSRAPNDQIDELKYVFDIPQNLSDYRTSMLTMGLILSALGFARDKRIGKEDKSASIKGMRSQFRDCQHIAASAGTSIFLTADKGCARIAFALYEHFQIKTSVWFLERSRESYPVARIVGPDYWP